ncbi:MAG: TIGR03557 family F420-dependent LLM class oxidoreductase, partial [Actinomycetota bacterium]|nr:TIGR03557 family F420-dependent LLM class oxidoreductase [Actinomycetota bacterium]
MSDRSLRSDSARSVRLGWWLSSEEHDPRRLVESAVLAEQAGFATAMISDHLQPWVRKQGHAGHVWTTIGAIAEATDRLEIGTGVTAMLHRSHPIDVAHAAATAAILLEERFFLGVGSGERLNEQPFARRWPRAGERRERLREAIDVLRQLWSDKNVNVDGKYWRVENLRLLDRPASPPPIYIAASGKRSASLAGEVGDGVIGVTPDSRLIDVYHGAGGDGPCIAQVHVSIADTMDAAADLAWQWWPNGAVAPALLSELARPEHFEAVANTTEHDAIYTTVVCATDAEPIVRAIDHYVGAGFDTI